MKNLIAFISLSLVGISCFSQVLFDKKVLLTGSGAQGKVEGVREVADSFDAVNKLYVDTAIANRTSASDGGGQCVFIPSITPPAGYYFTGFSQELSGNGQNYTVKATYPRPRKLIRAISWGNDSLYTFGHEIISGSSSDNQIWYRYRPSQNSWVQMNPNQPSGVPYVRYSLEQVNDRIYIIQGHLDNTCAPTNFMWEFNPQNNVFTARANPPIHTASPATAVANGKIYVFGGNSTCNSFGGGFRQEAYEYNPISNTWTQRANLPVAAGGQIAETVNGKIYIIGGSISGNSSTANVYEYNPSTNTYTSKSPLPVGRFDHASAVYNNKIYIFGGNEPSVNESRRVDIYDPATNTWTRGENLPAGRTQMTAVTMGNRIYLIGGSNGSSAYNTTWEYNPTQDTGPVFFMHCKP